MSWKQIRLTLARTPEYPSGSSEHAYELVLPVRTDGIIDLAAFERMPGRATVQRLWPGQGTMHGAILRRSSGFAFSYEPGDADDEQVFHLEDHPLCLGEYVTLTEPDGDRLAYQIVAVRALPDQVSSN